MVSESETHILLGGDSHFSVAIADNQALLDARRLDKGVVVVCEHRLSGLALIYLHLCMLGYDCLRGRHFMSRAGVPLLLDDPFSLVTPLWVRLLPHHDRHEPFAWKSSDDLCVC
jgi:hypothetical protein